MPHRAHRAPEPAFADYQKGQHHPARQLPKAFPPRLNIPAKLLRNALRKLTYSLRKPLVWNPLSVHSNRLQRYRENGPSGPAVQGWPFSQDFRSTRKKTRTCPMPARQSSDHPAFNAESVYLSTPSRPRRTVWQYRQSSRTTSAPEQWPCRCGTRVPDCGHWQVDGGLPRPRKTPDAHRRGRGLAGG